MPSPVIDRVQCALVVQRLMDADVLLPEEGNALLREIEAWNPPADNADVQRTHADRLIQALESIMQTGRLNASARQAALETALVLIMHQPTDSAAPETQPGKPRD